MKVHLNLIHLSEMFIMLYKLVDKIVLHVHVIDHIYTVDLSSIHRNKFHRLSIVDQFFRYSHTTQM